MQLILKAELKDDIRRLAVPASITYVELLQRMRTLYQLAGTQNLLVKYVDDEKDLVTISSEDEMAEAIRVSTRQGLVLRIFLFLSDEPMPLATELKEKQLKDSLYLPPAIPSMAVRLPTPTPVTPGEAENATEKKLDTVAPTIPEPEATGTVYIPIAERTESLAKATHQKCADAAAEIADKTAKIVFETAAKCSDLSTSTINMVDLIRTDTAGLARETAARCETIAHETANKCTTLSNQIADQTAEYSRLAEAHLNTELAKQWNNLAMQISQRCAELSSEINQRLQTL